MEQKQKTESKICGFCGTVYDGNLDQCPLCGNHSEEAAEAGAVPKKKKVVQIAQTEGAAAKPGEARMGREPAKVSAEPQENEPQSKKHKTEKGKRKYLKKKDRVPGKYLMATAILLAATVLVLLYFIGDMIGWWPGLEDVVTVNTEAASETKNTCTVLRAEPEDAVLEFSAMGEIGALNISVNPDCDEEITVTVDDETVAVIAPETLEAINNGNEKTQKFLATALAEGETKLTVSCGEQVLVGKIVCSFAEGEETEETTTETEEETEKETSVEIPGFEPELNLDDISFFAAKESFVAEITNLPEGVTVSWSSADESVATVDASGRVVARSKGTTEITAEAGGATAVMVVRCNFTADEADD